MNTIGNNIQKYRQRLGLSQQSLADTLFVSQQAIQKWETGKSVPQADKISEIAKILRVSVSDILLDDTEFVSEYEAFVDTTGQTRKQMHGLMCKQELSYKERIELMCLKISLQNPEHYGRSGYTLCFTEKSHDAGLSQL